MSIILTSVIMFVFWILLSGELSFIPILSGVISSLFVGYISYDLLIGNTDLKLSILRMLRFIKYLPWLFWQIILANLDLVYRTLHPSMPIEPQMVEFDTPLKSEVGITILANSITLTPGTVTVVANKEGKFIVHAIAHAPATSLMEGEMQTRVKDIEGA